MEKLNIFIENNNFEECVNFLEKYENNESDIKLLINMYIENNYIFIIYLLIFISHKKNIPFWYNITGYTLSFYLSHIDGAERTALSMFKKSFELDPKDSLTLDAILDFRNPPEKILTPMEIEYYLKFKTN